MSKGDTMAKQIGGARFSDEEFPASSTSIGDVDVSDIQWLRPTDFSSAPELFIDGAEAGDVIQGQLGDCWLLGALSVIASREEFLNRCVISAHPENGLYSFRFSKFGQWIEVVIDDQLPCSRHKNLVFASGVDENEFWTSLFEKAYAKLHKGYSKIVGGFVTDALCDLTGGIGRTIQFDKVRADIESGEFWNQIFELHNSGTAMLGCAMSTKSGDNEVDTGSGILQGHAYGILEIREYKGNKLLKIRNPWGCTEWKGDWSDEDSRWDKKLLHDLDHVLGDDGTFWISYEDFTKEYSKLYACYVLDSSWHKYELNSHWKGASAGGCPNNRGWINNPQFLLVNTENDTAQITVSLQQPDERYCGEASDHIGFAVFETQTGEIVKSYRPMLQTEVTNMREVTTEFSLDAGAMCVIVPFTFEPGKEKEFLLTCCSQNTLKANRIGSDDEAREVEIPSGDAPAVPIEAVNAEPDDPGNVFLNMLKQFGDKASQAYRKASRQASASMKKQSKVWKDKGSSMMKGLKKQFKKLF